MEEAKNIIPIWQPIGFSTHLITQRVSDVFGVKTAHTGTLDPMAEGVIIVLLDENRLNKKELAKFHKTYDFEICLGISTDTFDGLGLTNRDEIYQTKITKDEVENVLSSFIGSYTQRAPLFSTKKVLGKHLHEYGRENISVQAPEISGEIYNLKVISFEQVPVEDQIKKIISNIKKVSGEFRQENIISNWEIILHKNKGKIFNKIRIEVETSKGIYVRSLSQDICNKLGCEGFVSKLIRTKNGEYSRKNAQKMEQIFGKNYLKRYDFSSKYNKNH